MSEKFFQVEIRVAATDGERIFEETLNIPNNTEFWDEVKLYMLARCESTTIADSIIASMDLNDSEIRHRLGNIGSNTHINQSVADVVLETLLALP